MATPMCCIEYGPDGWMEWQNALVDLGFLSNRTFQVRVDNVLSTMFKSVNDILQGNSLIPTLLNMINDVTLYSQFHQ